MNWLRKIPFKLAGFALLAFSVAIIPFHVAVLTGKIPYTDVWGGRLESHEQMVQFEIISLIAQALLMLCIGMKMKATHPGLQKGATGMLYAFSLIFLLNTAGNLASKSTTEMVVFTPITLVAAVLCLRMAVERK